MNTSMNTTSISAVNASSNFFGKSQWLRICSSQQMRELDAMADSEYGLDAAILMENAGRSASQIILEQFPHAGRETEVLVFAGKEIMREMHLL